MTRTVVRRFGLDLERLVEDLSLTQASFIRCVKPNNVAGPRVLDARQVLAQLRCLGMTDLVRLMRSTYPTRIPYSLVHGRYATRMPELLSKLEPREFWGTLANVFGVRESDMYLGASKLFLRAGCGDLLEELSQMDIEEVRQAPARMESGILLGGAVPPMGCLRRHALSSTDRPDLLLIVPHLLPRTLRIGDADAH